MDRHVLSLANIAKVLPPIETANLDVSDVDELVKYTRDKMLKALTMLTESESGQHAFLTDPPSYKASQHASKDIAALSATDTVKNDTVGLEDTTDSDLRKRHTAVQETNTQNGIAEATQ